LPYRYRTLALLVLLAAVTYLDRMCIGVAGPRMQAELSKRRPPVTVMLLHGKDFTMTDISNGALCKSRFLADGKSGAMKWPHLEGNDFCNRAEGSWQ
jgi:hypothetical protein